MVSQKQSIALNQPLFNAQKNSVQQKSQIQNIPFRATATYPNQTFNFPKFNIPNFYTNNNNNQYQ